MAETPWGRVYFNDDFAGILRQEPGERHVFQYDPAYLERGLPAIAHTLPLRTESYYSEGRLHPFFDNLVAEGWLQNAQARALDVTPTDRFHLLLGFGHDCIGAVSVLDPDPQAALELESFGTRERLLLTGRASLSGIQRKLPVVLRNKEFWSAGPDERGTHIAKLASGDLANLIEIEWLATTATRALLPRDKIVEPELAIVKDLREPALIVRRFDRTEEGTKIHFEEFSQLLGKPAGDAKYEATYGDMADFMRKTPECVPAEVDQLFRRILACILIGNTDAHLKNFALFTARGSYRLAPAYDLVASALYPQFETLALGIGQAGNLNLRQLQGKHILILGESFGLPREAVDLALRDIEKRLEAATKVLTKASVGTPQLRKDLTTLMEKRWKGTFASIGKKSSRRQRQGAKN